MTEREIIRAKLLLLWGRTLKEHKIFDFDEWVKKHADVRA